MAIKKTEAVKPTKAKPKKAAVAVEEVVEVVEDATYTPELGVIALFKGDDEFLGEVVSFEPLEVVEHLLLNNCHATQTKEVTTLDAYAISPLTRAEVVEMLY